MRAESETAPTAKGAATPRPGFGNRQRRAARCLGETLTPHQTEAWLTHLKLARSSSQDKRR
jgi:hypothetical protein